MACERMACPIGSREQGAAGKPPPRGEEIISDPSKRSKISCKMAAGRAVHFQKRRRRGGGGSGKERWNGPGNCACRPSFIGSALTANSKLR